MRVSDFDYELPPDRIAQEPAERREDARLLVHDIAADRTEHTRVRELPRILRPGDLLVVNDTRVIPARVFGRRESGGRLEFLLLGPDTGARSAEQEGTPWRSLVSPSRRLKPGEEVTLEEGAARLRLLARPQLGEDGPAPYWLVEWIEPRAAAAVQAFLDERGRMPLPPYIERTVEREGPRTERDRERYQTVFAAHFEPGAGAVAAPTAGLHFSPDLLRSLEQAGVASASVTLHVGLGTFRPIQVEDTEDHRMHRERYELPARTAEALAGCRAAGGRVVAVGTTTVRTLETCARAEGELFPGPAAGETALFLKPGDDFLAVDALLTNFHLPKSTLLMLVSAFAGRERTLRLYREAIEEGYRFYSYGDAMLLH